MGTDGCLVYCYDMHEWEIVERETERERQRQRKRQRNLLPFGPLPNSTAFNANNHSSVFRVSK